ncbi:MAG TPA: hypothetical protein VI322_04170 [Candidatus Saccharimonadia bacterium]
MLWRLLAAISVSANDVGLPTSTRTIGAGLTNVANLMFGLVGSLAILALLYGGVQMSLSGGDAGKVKTARNTILYACVGIVLAAAAYMVVWFVSHNLFSGPDCCSN